MNTTRYALGSIPSFFDWQADSLAFTITSTLGPGTIFSMRPNQRPKGTISLDPASGFFFYRPTSDDTEEFTVWIRARNGSKEEQQTISIPPPRLPSDFNIIQHVGASPDPRSPSYLIYSEQSAGQMVFNYPTDYEDKEAEKVKVETKHVTVSGIQVVLEADSATYPLFDRLHNKTDIQRLTLCADEVILRSPLNLPGTDVHIYANSLKFEGAGAFNTTPIALTGRTQKRETALNGQKGGNIYLFVTRIDMPGQTIRFITNGAAGQAARLGVAGDPGKSRSPWGGKYTARTNIGTHEEVNWSYDFEKKLKDFTPVYAEIWDYYEGRPFNKKEDWWWKVDDASTNDVPTDGEDPKVMPGSPGRGGGSGSIFTDFPDLVKRRVTQQVGATGQKADDIEPSLAGTPSKWCHVRAEYQRWFVPPFEKPGKGEGAYIRRYGLKILKQGGPTKNGKGATAPGPVGDAPEPGRIQALPTAEPVHRLKLVRAALPFVHDALLAGQREDARKMLLMCRQVFEDNGLDKNHGLAEADYAESSSLYDEVMALLERTDGPYDYFGNPAGWAPMLSFETNLKLYEGEVEDAIRTLFLVYWMENTDKRQQNVKKTLREALARLKTENEKAIADYNTALGKVQDLKKQSGTLERDIDRFTAELADTQKDLRRLANDDLQLEKTLRGSAKVLGGLMQLIPYGQPALGAVGKSATVLSDIDLDKPTAGLPKLAGAWSDVIQQKLVPRISSLWNGLNKAEADAEAKDKGDGKAKAKDDGKAKGKDDEKAKARDKGDAEFEKALEKKQLAERVSAQLKEKTAVKAQVMSAFSSFAVSEDELDARLAKVLADSPEYKSLNKKVKDLNQRKKDLSEELTAALNTIDRSATTSINNQLARIELSGQLDATLDHLSGEAMHYARGMGQRARQRLLKYQYYLLKSYHYLMLQEMQSVDFGAQKMFDAFAEKLATSPDGILSKDEYASLKVVFEDQLKQITGAIIDWYETHPPARTGSLLVSLSPDQLATLNAPAGRLDLDLMEMGYLNFGQEDIRITDIEAKTVELDSPPADQAVNVSLIYRHDGISRFRRGGKLYLFRSGDYSIAGTKGETSPTRYRDDNMFWGNDITYSRKKQKVKTREPDPATVSLLRYLIGDPKSEADVKSSLLSYRPSAWGGLTILRSVTPSTYPGKLTDLVLKVKYVSYNVDDSLATVFVMAPREAEPLIRIDAVDANERKDGRGAFLRTFDRTGTPCVTLTAPARSGRQKFAGWQIVGEQGDQQKSPQGATVQASGSLHPDRNLTLDFGMRSVYQVVPTFEPMPALPVVDDSWPACPPGWGFVDWLLVNKLKQSISIEQYAVPPKWQQVRLSVDQPAGSGMVRLAFERLVLAPGEETKISVCLSPMSGRPRGDLIEFDWTVGPMQYMINFNAQGEVSKSRVWDPAEETVDAHALDIDKDNRTISVVR